ncbi:50S ribosomal protein L23 [Halanaerobium salsuginis]|jgi:large subunit ribosomal protein L23|uniref:Large ribosomal subunit protein uL23 n=1 Tax=Halanaerobium salsuginis TaxID=29563 RepID=A0A1I4LKT7_9FIRM|nr:50S ribosomal protein L23 [Halanaerobium salsuginis]SFL91569.1 LSU ribosomal protein L23P [Halanaerobium salsuginis]
MKDARDIIIAPIISENTMEQMQEANTYTFKVAKKANKVEIRKAIEEIFSVKVINVNTINVRGKKRRLGFHIGKKPDWKKALVKLADGEEIEIYEGL